MKKIKAFTLCAILSLVTFATTKACVIGTNGVVIWPCKDPGDNGVVIWPLIQSAALTDPVVTGNDTLDKDFSDSASCSSIEINYGSTFTYWVYTSSLYTNVSFSDWPLGDYTAKVNFTDGTCITYSFTLSNCK